MRLSNLSSASVVAVLAVLLVAGCSGGAEPEASPSETVDSSATPSPSTSEATETPTTEAATPSPTETAASFTFPTTLAPEVMLPSSDGAAAADEQEWAFSDCGATIPPEATDTRVMYVGDGAWEIPVGVQQVVAFADEAAAAAELDRLAENWAACAAEEPVEGMAVYHVEPFPVGENGVQLVVDYSDAIPEYGDDAVGYVAALFRRGNTVTLVGALGGESTIGSSRQTAAAMGSAAWDLLCVHDASGCAEG